METMRTSRPPLVLAQEWIASLTSSAFCKNLVQSHTDTDSHILPVTHIHKVVGNGTIFFFLFLTDILHLCSVLFTFTRFTLQRAYFSVLLGIYNLHTKKLVERIIENHHNTRFHKKKICIFFNGEIDHKKIGFLF